MLLALLALALCGPALAGPPFFNDDPVPTDLGHWELYGFGSAARTPGITEGDVGFDLNYGPATDVQLTATLPLSYRTGPDSHGGLGDIEAGVKYRFLHQSGDAIPDVAVFPRVILPTSGEGHARLLLPVWAQRDAGPWSLFGGGGFTINPGRDQRGYWQGGLGLTRKMDERLTLGAEVFHQTPDAIGARPYTALNFGALYRLKGPWSLLMSGGPGVQNPDEGGRYKLYMALRLDY